MCIWLLKLHRRQHYSSYDTNFQYHHRNIWNIHHFRHNPTKFQFDSLKDIFMRQKNILLFQIITSICIDSRKFIVWYVNRIWIQPIIVTQFCTIEDSCPSRPLRIIIIVCVYLATIFGLLKYCFSKLLITYYVLNKFLVNLKNLLGESQ